jgi:hypothetical protein
MGEKQSPSGFFATAVIRACIEVTTRTPSIDFSLSI